MNNTPCLFLQGRDFKVHCGSGSAPWFSSESVSPQRTSPINNSNNSPVMNMNNNKNSSKTPSPISPSPPPPTTASLIPTGSGSSLRVPLQKSPTCATVVFPGVPGAGGQVSTCFMASKKQPSTSPQPQLSFVNNKANENFVNSFTQKQQQQQKNSNSNIPRIQQQQQQQHNPHITFQQQLQQQRDAIERKLGATIQTIKATRGEAPTPIHINGQIIHPGNGNRNGAAGTNGVATSAADNNNNSSTATALQPSSSPPGSPSTYRTGVAAPLSRTSSGSGSSSPNTITSSTMPQPQQQLSPLRRSATAIGVHHGLYSPSIVHHGNRNLIHHARAGGILGKNDSSGESDTDLEFLKQIDFETIDGQELQELLSSF